MSQPMKVAPVLGGGHSAGTDAITKVIQDVVEALGKAFGNGGDETPEKPSSLVTIRKTVTVYEFDAEGIARALVKTGSAIAQGLKWPQPGQDEPQASSPPRSPPNPFPPSFAFFVGPDGRLTSSFLGVVIPHLLRMSHGSTSEEVYARAAELVKKYAPEEHREQVLEALQTSYEAMKKSAEEFVDPPRPAADQVYDPNLTPGGHRVVVVKTFDHEKDLKTLLPEPFVEILIDVGPNRPPAAFRGKTKEEAMEKADIALKRNFDVCDEGASDDELAYEGDMRDATSPSSLEDGPHV